ncbi:MAG: hypothetical protein NCA08_01510 [Deltaproteobacteria bacterium]|nr:hypothetical protein [Candidatus Deferrimicrobium borealis]
MANNKIKPRILMIAPSCYPPGNPEAFVNANLVLAALEDGWHVDVITMENLPHWYPNNLIAWQKIASCMIPVIEHKKTLANQFSSFFKTFGRSCQFVKGGRWALPAADAAIQLASEKKYDFIISRVLPPMAHLAALIVALRTGIPWIANWNDPVPFRKSPKPYGEGKHSSLGFFAGRYYREVAERAIWHTFPCERLRKYVTSYLPSNINEKSSVVPHISLIDKAANVSRSSGFTLMHAGSLRPPRSPYVFLQGIKIFIDRVKPRSEFSTVFIVDRPEEVRNAARIHGVERFVRIENSRSYTEMPAALEVADVLVIIEALVDEGIFLPSKFVDYVRIGRPILAISPTVGTLADIIAEHGGGISVDGRSAEAVADALQLLYTEWMNGTLDSKYNSSTLYNLYNKKAILNKYIEIFNIITERYQESRLSFSAGNVLRSEEPHVSTICKDFPGNSKANILKG